MEGVTAHMIDRLPAGITGTPGVSCRALDFKIFKQACYEAARRTNGRVLRMRSEKDYRGPFSYRDAYLALQYGDRAVRVLCNKYEPYVAFAGTAHEYDPPANFVDCAELAEFFPPPFVVLSKADVERIPSADLTKDLCDRELEYLRYWKPRTIGQIIYNTWD